MKNFKYVNDDIYLARKIACSSIYEQLCRLLLDGKTAAPFFVSQGITSIAIYGVEGIGRIFYRYMCLSGVKVDCFVDRNWAKYDQKNFMVIGLDKMQERGFQAIVIAVPEYQRGILRDLQEYGWNLNKTFTVSQVLFGIQG